MLPVVTIVVHVIFPLRLLCQAFGCVASMFVISPKLTGLMAVVVSAIVTVGSLFGSALRRMSRTTQAQVTYIISQCHTAVVFGRCSAEAMGSMSASQGFCWFPVKLFLTKYKFSCVVQNHQAQVLHRNVCYC